MTLSTPHSFHGLLKRSRRLSVLMLERDASSDVVGGPWALPRSLTQDERR